MDPALADQAETKNWNNAVSSQGKGLEKLARGECFFRIWRSDADLWAISAYRLVCTSFRLHCPVEKGQLWPSPILTSWATMTVAVVSRLNTRSYEMTKKPMRDPQGLRTSGGGNINASKGGKSKSKTSRHGKSGK